MPVAYIQATPTPPTIELVLLRGENAVAFLCETAFQSCRNAELQKYSRFVEIIHAFREHYSLGRFSLRQIDIYLWLAGKDAFKKSDKPKMKRGGQL